jgi:hypothetical protein
LAARGGIPHPKQRLEEKAFGRKLEYVKNNSFSFSIRQPHLLI